MCLKSTGSYSDYTEITPLCKKGNVILVRKEDDGQLYVKKYLQCYDREIYLQLCTMPVANTPRIYEIFQEESEDGETPVLVVIEEYLPGATLAELLEEEGPFSEKETFQMGLQLCEILMELHGRKSPIIHRDIKPSNVLRTSDGKMKLLDFNAAKTGHSVQGRDTVLLGTAGFAAPEQYGFSSSSPQTDMYALGVLFNVMLTGRLPSEKQAEGKIKPVIQQCLELNPRDRYQDVKELYRALKYKSKVKAEWMLPGFRTLQPLHMILALMGYGLMAAAILTPEPASFESLLTCLTYRIGMGLSGVLMICFYCNYLNMQKWFPFMRSRRKSLRILGLCLGPFLIVWVVMLLVVLAEDWILPGI